MKISKVLFGLHYLQPLTDSYTIRSHQVIEYLKQHYQLKTIPYSSKDSNRLFSLIQVKIRDKKFFNALIKAAKEFLPDLIHINSPWKLGNAAIEISNNFEIPMIYEVRGFENSMQTRPNFEAEKSKKAKALIEKETNVMFYADRIIATSSGIQQEIMRRGIEAEKIVLIPHCINLTKFALLQPQEQSLRLIQKYNLENAQVIGYIGTIRYSEGLHFLIQAIPDLLRQIPNLKLIIIGNGPALQSLKGLTREKRLQNYILFPGEVEHSQIREYYSIVNLMVLPGISCSTNEIVSPAKILEAMAVGKVVLGADVGGNKEVIQNGRTGFVFKKENTDNFISKCTTLLTRDRLRTKIAHSARTWVEKHRDWQIIQQKYNTVYEETLNVFKR